MGDKIASGRIWGPFPKEEFETCRSNAWVWSQRAIHQAGGVSLRIPEVASVNDGIDLHAAVLPSVYFSGPGGPEPWKGALLVKLDIKSAYCLITIHPDNCCLLVFKWQGAPFINAWYAALGLAFCTVNIHCDSRCIGIDYPSAGCQWHWPLHWWFRHNRPTKVWCVWLCSGAWQLECCDWLQTS